MVRLSIYRDTRRHHHILGQQTLSLQNFERSSWMGRSLSTFAMLTRSFKEGSSEFGIELPSNLPAPFGWRKEWTCLFSQQSGIKTGLNFTRRNAGLHIGVEFKN